MKMNIDNVIKDVSNQIDEEFLNKLMETLKKKRKFAELFHEIKPINKIKQKNRKDDDLER